MSCITLLSDFGLQDASVASAKGILMQHVPGVPVIDITHLIEPFQLQQAAYLLATSYNSFPKGSIHILLFEIFSEKKPRLVLAEKDGHYFLSPDNGLLSIAFGNSLEKVWKCFELNPPAIFKDWLHELGIIAADLINNKMPRPGMEPYDLKVASKNSKPAVDANYIECQVLHIDRYENVIINLTRSLFEEVRQGRNFSLQFMRDEEIREISTHYNDVREGEKLCRFNSAGYLEIAINHDKAASLLGLRIAGANALYHTIKIFFE